MSNLKHILSPFSAWLRAFSKPYTVPAKDTHREGSERYRGWHINDVEACIGCGTCADICQNVAIDMVPVDEPTKGDSGLRPMLDYGRCCWCALCIDVCPSNSLGMSNEYSWHTDKPEDYRYIPGVDKKDWDTATRGWRKEPGYDLFVTERVPMPMLPEEERVKTWAEVVIGYTEAQAREEAARCVECGICISACPAHMRIPDYIAAIREADYEKAVEYIYDNNPFPEMCGKVCTRECESVCSIGLNGEPVAIRWLKRFATEQFQNMSEVIKPRTEDMGHGQKIAIIGGGPSGITVAYYLAIRGYDVTIYDGLPKLGGATFFGIPKYRFPISSLDKQVDLLVAAGVTIKVNTRVNAEMFDRLRVESAAVFIGTGLMKPRSLRAPGEDLPGVMDALSFLTNHHIGKPAPVNRGDIVVVVGGGNTAVDAARVSRRMGADVVMAYRRRKEDMPADWEELEDAEAENVAFICQNVPLRVEEKGGQLDFIWGPSEMVADKPGRRPRPKLIEGVEHHLPCDKVIVAVGQGPDLSWLSPEMSGQIGDKGGWIAVDDDGMTKVDGVYAGGDLVNETADAISAIADGLKVVQGILRKTAKAAKPAKTAKLAK